MKLTYFTFIIYLSFLIFASGCGNKFNEITGKTDISTGSDKGDVKTGSCTGDSDCPCGTICLKSQSICIYKDCVKDTDCPQGSACAAGKSGIMTCDWCKSGMEIMETETMEETGQEDLQIEEISETSDTETVTDPCNGTCADPYPCCSEIMPGNWACTICGPGCESACISFPTPCACNFSSFICEKPEVPGSICGGTTFECSPKQCSKDYECKSSGMKNAKCNAKSKTCYLTQGECNADAGLCCYNPEMQCVPLSNSSFQSSICGCSSNKDCPQGIDCMNLSSICKKYAIPGVCDSGLEKACLSYGMMGPQ
jgi:hypothetical protein